LAGAQTAPAKAQQPVSPRQQINAKITLDTSPSLFATLAALNLCGFELDAANSDPLRATIRSQADRVANSSVDARAASMQICEFIHSHERPEKSQELAQYVSLALNMTGPPFALKGKEADLPPDTSNVAGFPAALEKFNQAVGLARIWNANHAQYEQRLQTINEPLSKMLLTTDLYLKLPQSSYLGREFVIYVDPQLPPGQVNARNYGSDYAVAISPARIDSHMDEIRHTYLHYVLDPLMLKRAKQMARFEPLMQAVQSAPIDETYKRDATLLLTESLIRAIEARLLAAPGDGKQIEAARSAKAEEAMKEGFVLTRYFYEQLVPFEKDPVGIRDAFADLIYQIDVPREQKRIAGIQFSAARASSEVLGSAAAPQEGRLLDIAEEKLKQNDIQGARRIAQQVLDEKTTGEDPGRALFVMARTAALTRDVDGAQAMFERALEVARQPRIVAWSHISLGRILDLKCSREQALTHYRAALTAGDPAPETKAAAERGIATAPGERCQEGRN
jgi:tetratricopeptide (TPR) repeat protein